MTDQQARRPYFGASHEDEQNEYHAISGLAVTALVLGVLSVVALVDPRAALVSAVGILLGAVALWRIARRSPELIGRKAALAGLLLSLLFGSVAVGHWSTCRWLLTRQARQFAVGWFELVAQRQPHVAHQFLFQPDDRQSPGDDVWEFYCSNQKHYEALKKFLDEPLVRTLGALGKKATVRLYAIEEIDARANQQRVVGLYAVTFDHDGRKTTFLVRLTTRRVAAAIAGRPGWQVVGLNGGVRPAREEQEPWLTEE